MDVWIWLLGTLGMIGCVPVFLAKLIKKQSKKKVGITFLISFAMFVIALFMPGSSETADSITHTPAPTITSVLDNEEVNPTEIPTIATTEEPTPTKEPTAKPTATTTSVPTEEPTKATEQTATPKPTATPVPTSTPTPEPTATSTPTPEPTSTPMPTATTTPKPTNTPVPTSTPVPEPEEDNVCESFSVTYLNVGQGDAAIIECNGHYMLIDGGDKEYSSKMYSYLKTNGIDTLDIIVASHAHSDHVGGLAGALNFAKAKLVLCPVTENDTEAFANFKKYAEKNGPGITVPKIGDKYQLGAAEVEILGLNSGTENNSSIVLTVTLDGYCFLFTGDTERDGELAVLDNLNLPDMVILKVGHHGSSDSTTYQFLREVMPTYAIISCGTGNSYGHPTDATLSKLRDADTIVYRTDLNGDINFVYDGTQWNIGCEKEVSYEKIMTPGDSLMNIPEQPEEVPEKTTPSGTDYIGNKNSKVFHYTWCNSVDRMKESNKVFFYSVTREDVIAKGYKPCGNCNP